MAKLAMKKIEIIALLSDSQSIVERLQRRGVVELHSIDDDRIVKMNTNFSLTQFEKSLSSANTALAAIEKYSLKKKSLLSMLNGREPISTETFACKKNDCSKTLAMCKKIENLLKAVNEATGEITRLVSQEDMLLSWRALDVPQSFKGTESTAAFIGSLPGQLTREDAETLLEKNNAGGIADITIVSSRKEQTCLFALCHKDNSQCLSEALSNIGFVTYSSQNGLTASEEIADIEEKINGCKKTIEQSTEKICALGEYKKSIEFLVDFITMKIDKYKAINELSITDSTVIVTGFIPAKFVKGLTKEFEEKYTVAITTYDTTEEDDVPVLLSNGAFSEPVEGITEMYSLPGKRDVDPSSIMAFFYYFFFGMMLSDAGYGLLILIITTLILKRTTVEGTLRRSIRMFRYCGISTLFWGAMFGSWFGDMPQQIAGIYFGKTIESTALWFEPIDDPIKLLLYCCVFGIAHLFLGLCVNFHILWKEGRRLDAVCDVIPVMLTVIGAAPVCANMLSPMPESLLSVCKYILIAGVVLVVLTAGRSSKNIFVRFFGGIYGLYNVATGYLSDILSYSRLLALGLATGCIGNAINMIATMPENMVLKTIMLIVVGIAGHGVNIAINMLGAYVHADRLQFVELFSKFYEGGGRAFSPLKANTKFYKFIKENIYE